MSSTAVNTPGVFIKEVMLSGPPILGVGTSTAGFVGESPKKAAAFLNTARLVTSADQFTSEYIDNATRSTDLSRAVLGFFRNGGTKCYVVDTGAPAGGTTAATLTVAGLKLLEVIDEIALIATPGRREQTVNSELKTQAENTGDRFALLDSPPKVSALTDLKPGGGNRPSDSIYCGYYYPRIQVAKELSGDPATEFVSPVGHIAGVFARVDAARGVHKAPANEEIRGSLGLEHLLTDNDQDALNVDGVNVLRLFSGNTIIWGARTLLAQTAADKSYMYVNIRRLVNYIEESLQVGLRWAVFEPNNLALRQQITRSVRGFLDGVWRDGALFGATAEEAYYVKFPEMLNRDEDRAAGKLTIEIGLRVTYPAEFIIVRIGLLMQSAAGP